MRICAGIVTYNPEICRFVKVLKSILAQVEKVIIFDNGSENLDEISSIIKENENVSFLISKENKGIAYALNRICEQACLENYDWIITLDHDTICEINMIKSMEKLIAPDVGIICPRVHYVNLHIREKGDINERYTLVPACMTSGSLMSLGAWEKTGGFDEWMFIDWVDNDICMKLRINNFKIIRDNRVFMEHQLGRVRPYKFLFWSWNDYGYSAFRLYYICRNGLYFVKKYYKNINIIKYILRLMVTNFKLIVINIKDKTKMQAIFKGIKDGLKVNVEENNWR